jgi:hypothetical protein
MPDVTDEIDTLIKQLHALGCAVVVFQPSDVEELIRKDADPYEFLANNSRQLEDRMVEAGFEALEVYASMDGVATDDDDDDDEED